MNKRTKWIIAVLVVLNIVLITLLILGKPPHHQNPREMIISRLNMSTTQVQKYDELIAQHQKSNKVLHDKVKVLKEEFAGHVLATDEAMIDSLSNEIGKVLSEVELNNAHHLKDINGILNDSQKKDFEDFVKEIPQLFNPPNPRR